MSWMETNQAALCLVALGGLSIALALLTKPVVTKGEKTASDRFRGMSWQLFVFTAVCSVVAGVIGLIMGPATL